MTTEVRDRVDEMLIVQLGDQRCDPRALRAVSGEPPAQLGRVTSEQALVLRIGHRVDAGTQLRSARTVEELAQELAVLDGDDLPPGCGEQPAQLVGGHVRHHAVQGLTVQVDDPDQLTELGHVRVEHRLPDGALVELRVAHQRELPPTGPRLTYRRAIAPQIGAVAPMPTDPVE